MNQTDAMDPVELAGAGAAAWARPADNIEPSASMAASAHFGWVENMRVLLARRAPCRRADNTVGVKIGHAWSEPRRTVRSRRPFCVAVTVAYTGQLASECLACMAECPDRRGSPARGTGSRPSRNRVFIRPLFPGRLAPVGERPGGPVR